MFGGWRKNSVAESTSVKLPIKNIKTLFFFAKSKMLASIHVHFRWLSHCQNEDFDVKWGTNNPWTNVFGMMSWCVKRRSRYQQKKPLSRLILTKVPWIDVAQIKSIRFSTQMDVQQGSPTRWNSTAQCRRTSRRNALGMATDRGSIEEMAQTRILIAAFLAVAVFGCLWLARYPLKAQRGEVARWLCSIRKQ